jgi:hypothetical protein
LTGQGEAGITEEILDYEFLMMDGRGVQRADASSFKIQHLKSKIAVSYRSTATRASVACDPVRRWEEGEEEVFRCRCAVGTSVLR